MHFQQTMKNEHLQILIYINFHCIQTLAACLHSEYKPIYLDSLSKGYTILLTSKHAGDLNETQAKHNPNDAPL